MAWRSSVAAVLSTVPPVSVAAGRAGTAGRHRLRPTTARSHHLRIRRMPVLDDHRIYQQPCQLRMPLRPHHGAPVDVVPHHNPHHAADPTSSPEGPEPHFAWPSQPAGSQAPSAARRRTSRRRVIGLRTDTRCCGEGDQRSRCRCRIDSRSQRRKIGAAVGTRLELAFRIRPIPAELRGERRGAHLHSVRAGSGGPPTAREIV
jgi:hypothetical protein